MSENNKNHIDDMFAKAIITASEEIPFEMDWNSMRVRLEEEKLIKKPFYKGMYFFPLLLLIGGAAFSSVLYLTFKNNKTEQLANKVESRAVNSSSLKIDVKPLTIDKSKELGLNESMDEQAIVSSNDQIDNKAKINLNDVEKYGHVNLFVESNESFSPLKKSSKNGADMSLPIKNTVVVNKSAPKNNITHENQLNNSGASNPSSNKVKDKLPELASNNVAINTPINNISSKNDEANSNNQKIDEIQNANNEVAKVGLAMSKNNLNETITTDNNKVSNHRTIKNTVEDSLKNDVSLLAKQDSIALKVVDSLAIKKDTVSTASNQIVKKEKELQDTLRRWSLGGYLGFNQSGYHLNTSNSIGDTLLMNNEAEIKGQANLNYTFGLLLSYKLNKKISLQFGFLYAQKTKVQSNVNKYFIPTDSNGLAYKNYNFNFSAKYIESQLGVKYYFNQHKLRFYTLLAVIAQFNIPQSDNYFKLDSYDKINSTSKNVALSSLSLGIATQVSLGLEYTLNKHWSVFVEPTFKYDFRQVIKNETFNENLIEHYTRAFGVGLGTFYSF